MAWQSTGRVIVLIGWFIDLLVIPATFLYLLDQDWSILFAGFVAVSIIGTLLVAIYAAFASGYWLLLLAIVTGLVLVGIGSSLSEGE